MQIYHYEKYNCTKITGNHWMNNINIKHNQILTNNEIMEIFKCACEGGIRISKRTKTVVLVINTFKGCYNDISWQDGILNYRGSGSKGNQSIEKGLNKSLLLAFRSNTPVYLFDVKKDKEYSYLGEVVLSNEPFQEEQPDKEGKMRKVWMFPLKLKNSK